MHTHSRQQAALSLVLVTLLMAIGFAIDPPEAYATGWPQNTTNTATDVVVTHPSGAVTLLSCGTYSYADRQYGLRTINADGTNNTTVDNEMDNEVNLSACLGDDVVSADGTVFAHEADGNTGAKEIVAYKNGSEIWRRATTTNCGDTVDPEARAVGSDGNLYLLYRSCGRVELVSLNAATGAVRFQNIVENTSSPIGLDAYNGGVVYRKSSTSSVKWRYFNLNGVEDTMKTRQVSSASGQYLNTHGISATGKAFVGVTQHNVSSCGGAYNVLMKVVSYDPQTGNETTYNTASHCLQNYSGVVNPLPSGGAVVRMTDSSNDGYLMYFGASSGVTVHTLPKPIGINGTVTYAAPQVDVNGNVVVVGWFSKQNDSRDRPFVDVLLYDSSGNRLARYQPPVAQNEYFRLASQVPFGLTQGYVYLSQCHANSCANNTNAQTLHKIAFAEVGIDYPRGAVLGVPASPVTAKKYVALGDSFSSGEGVEPFISGTADPPYNDCHRSQLAYSRGLADDPALSLNSAGFWACSGAETKHITTDLQYPYQPTQVDMVPADTDVLTLTIGGNDVGFADFAGSCVVGSCDGTSASYNTITGKISNDLPAKLEDAYEAIADKVGNQNARILISGYPYVTPLRPASFPGACAYLTFDEQDAVFTITNQLNQVIEDAVNERRDNGDTRFEYVDPNSLDSPFRDHQLCWPDEYFIGVNNGNVVRYTFHPNARGQAAFATLFRRQLLSNP